MGEAGSSRNEGRQPRLSAAQGRVSLDQQAAAQRPRSSSRFATRVSLVDERRRNEWLAERAGKRTTPTRIRGELLHSVPFNEDFQGLYSLCYSPGGDVIACGYGNGNIQVRWSEAAALKLTIRSGSGQSSVPIMSCRFDSHKGDRFFAASACGTIFSCNTTSGEFTRFAREEKNEVNALDVDLEGHFLMTGGRDTKVRIYDIPTEKLVHTYQQTATMGAVEPCFRGVHSERVFAVRNHPLLQFVFLTGGWDKAVKIWDIRQKKNCVNTFFGPHICGDGIDVKSNSVITGSWVKDFALQLWDLRGYKKIEDVVPTNRQPNRRGEFLYVAKFFDGDPYGDMVLAGGSGLSNVEVISIKDKKILGSWSSDFTVHSVDSYRNFITFGGAEAIIKVCDFV